MFLQLLTALSLLKVVLASFCDQTFTFSSGTVSSPSFSRTSVYANNLNCQYDIQVSYGYGIKLSWSTFDIKGNMPDCYDDYVEIYIGCGRYSIGKYCTEYGAFNLPFDVYSPDDCLRIKFHSNSSGAGKGFQGYYSSVSLGFGTSNVGAECSSYSESYPKILSSTSGIISSPRWPRYYPTSRDCYWRIDVDAGKSVKIAVMDFYLEYDYYGCDNDKLKIKGGRSGDSYDRSDTIKDSMCGEKNPFYFTSSDRRIWIRFKSDRFNTERGFVVGYVKYDSKTVSGSTSGPSVIGIVVGILIPIVVIACVCYVCVYRKRQARRAQQQGAHVTVPPQPMTVQHPPPPPPQGYAPPPQQGYAPPPQQGYAPPPQPGYGPPPQQGYGPPQQPGYPNQAPPPYNQVAGTPYPPPQDKSEPNPYPPGQPSGVSPYPGAAPPYPPGQPGAVPPYPPGQPGGVPPYPPEQPPGGESPYPSAPPTATAPPQ